MVGFTWDIFYDFIMHFLSDPHLDLTTSRIETPRCVLVPFSTDGRVDIHELAIEFCKANKDLYVSPYLPNYEQELEFIHKNEVSIRNGEIFENFILEKWTNRLIGCVGFNTPEEHRMNIGLWIRVDEHGKWYATEVYTAMIDWARKNMRYTYLKHSLNPENIASRKLALKFGGVLQDEITDKEHIIFHIPV